MHLPRLFCLPSVPVSVANLIVIAGLMTACQPQNLATDGTPAITSATAKSQQTDSIAADENAADPDAGETISEAITQTVIASLPDADNTPEDNTDSTTTMTDNTATTTVASVPPQPSDDQSTDSETETVVASPKKSEPEIVKPAPPSPPPAFKPDTVLSKADSDLLSLLGVADIIRTEGQVRIWQYRLDRCVFDFFLTPANSQNLDGTYTVRDWAYRATTLGVTANELICRRALAKDRMRPASG